MNPISAFRCAYCAKVYENKESCRKHEWKCYSNPKSRSCATCLYLFYDYCERVTRHEGITKTCLRNVDISGKLTTRCELYHPRDKQPDGVELKKILNNYFPKHLIKPHLDRCKAELEIRLKNQWGID